jgi:hypothetical protein
MSNKNIRWNYSKRDYLETRNGIQDKYHYYCSFCYKWLSKEQYETHICRVKR